MKPKCLHCDEAVWCKGLCRFHDSRQRRGIPLDHPKHQPAAEWGPKGSEQYKAVSRAYAKKRYAERPDVREYQKSWNEKNKDRNRELDLKRRERSKQIIIKAKDKPCKDCEQKYPSYVLDFDHVRGEKIANIGSGRFHGSPKSLRAEIKKCDVVCANCHREREHRRRVE